MIKPLLVIALIIFQHILLAQDIYQVSRTTEAITIDGNVDEPIWKRVEPLILTMYTPTYQGDLTERTEIRILYDDDYIYTSARCYDSDAKGVQGPSLVRDVDKGGDFFNVLLDTFNDNENFVTFSTTPSGNRLDAQITNDAEGGQPFFWNQSWNGFWTNAVTRSEEGWFAEMRIPFSSLRFEDENGVVVFGMIVHRRIGRKNERQIFPAIPPNWDAAAWKPSQAQKIMFKGIKQKRALFVTPYALAGFEDNGVLGSDGGLNENDLKREAGLDVKYGISNNFNLDLTLNTDFAQVEADDQQVNLTRFSLFFPEKRQFFQERSGIFRFTLDGQDRLFHSRVIGIDGDGLPIRLLGGLRLTGRSKNLDVGFLNAQTASRLSLPTENFGLLRLRHRVFNPKSFFGGIFTTRISNQSTNLTYGVDGVFNLKRTYFLTMKGGQSFTDSLSNRISNNGFAHLVFENRAVSGLGYRLTGFRNGRDFNPGVGFRLRSDVTAARQEVWYGLFQGEQSLLRVITPTFSNSLFYNNGSSELETQITSLTVRFEMKTGTAFTLSASHNLDQPKESFNLSEDFLIEADRYKFNTIGATYTINDGRLLRFSLNAEVGEFYGGQRTSVQFSPFWNISPHLDVAADYIFNQVKFEAVTGTFRGDIQRLRINVALDSKLSFNSLIQFNKANDTAGVNLRCRYNFKEGNDLFLVYNQNVDTDATEGIDLLNRSLLVKYTYTFIRR